jgi:hypothetical protein
VADLARGGGAPARRVSLRTLAATRGAWVRLREWARADPARAAIRVGFVVLSLAAIGWDLPSSFGWENDGVAPRDIFAGVAQNLRPGSAFRYPLLHPLLLALLSLPVLVPAALRARSFALDDVQAAMLAPPVMTACALVGRLVAMAAALVALAALGRIASRLAGRRVGRWAEALAAVNLSFSYYGRATNLDGPALMWTVLAVERVLRVAGAPADGERRRRDLGACGFFVGASIATKDQAYASYVLLVPFIAWLVVRARAREQPRDWLRAVGVMVATYAAASGAVFNPTGFVTRVRTLVGGASADYRGYTRSAAGVLANLADIAAAQADLWWPWPVVALAWGGVALVVAAVVARRATAAALVPLGAGLGSLCGFALVVGRAEHRFVLSLGFWLSFYAAIALERAVAWLRARSAAPAVAAATTLGGALLLVYAALPAVALIATQWGDGRRAVEHWLARRPPGTTVETFGPLVYLPRFAPPALAPYRVARVGPEPVVGRNPQPGMDERAGTIAGARSRRPDVLILSEGFVHPFLDLPPVGARIVAEVTRAARSDPQTVAFVTAAVNDRLADYRRCFIAEPHLTFPFSARRIHGSTGAHTWVLARRDPAPGGQAVDRCAE